MHGKTIKFVRIKLGRDKGIKWPKS